MASAGGDAPTGGGAGSTPSARPSNRGEGNRGGRGRGGRGRGRGGGRGQGQGGQGQGQGDSQGARPERQEGGNRRRGGRRQSHGERDGWQQQQQGNGRPPRQTSTADKPEKTDNTDKPSPEEDEDAEVCFICANPVIHHSIAPCNHITCHICALRMRALYRNKDCPHCRTAAPYVIFTDDPAKRFEEYSDKDITSTDDNSGIKYANEEIVGDTVLLLRYNCPDESCDYAGLGWQDLHRHVRTVHHKKMCDLCTRGKKVFTHEHELFTDKGLERHMRHGDDRPGAIDQSGFKGHPLCSFCGERFYDDDKLYEHCRNKHERCFICDRRDSRQPHYYRNYDALEEHFRKDHYLCLDRECMEKKFVVFESEMDLKAHQLSEHGNSLSKDVRRDMQVVSLSDFDYRSPYQNGRGGRGGGGGGSGSGSGGGGGRNNQNHHEGRPSRGRDPNADSAPAISASSMRRDEIAYHRQLAIHSAQSVTNRTFGSQLSNPSPMPAAASGRGGAAAGGRGGATPASGSRPTSRGNDSSAPAQNDASALADPMQSLSVTDTANLSPQERARLVRHGAVIERATNMLGNNPRRMNAFRSHISSYRSGAFTAAQLVEAFFALFSDTSATALGSLLREVAELFDDQSKANALRRAWQDWRAINEDYPSLPTLGGMHGATTSNSGWAAAAAASPTADAVQASAGGSHKHSTRVLRLKHSTRPGGVGSSAIAASSSSSSTAPGPAPRTVPGATWTAPSSRTSAPPARPLASSSSSMAFPALPGAGKKSASSGNSWVAVGGSGGGSGSMANSLASRVGGGPGTGGARASAAAPRRPVGEDNFPALPAAPKPLTTIFGYGRGAVRRDLGGNRDTGFQWGGGDEGPSTQEAAPEEETTGKGKKKGKQNKKVLVQWG